MITAVEGNQSQAVAFPERTYHPRRESQRKRDSRARPTIGASTTSNGLFISLKMKQPFKTQVTVMTRKVTAIVIVRNPSNPQEMNPMVPIPHPYS
jgi:hypothetical protein